LGEVVELADLRGRDQRLDGFGDRQLPRFITAAPFTMDWVDPEGQRRSHEIDLPS
jgi:hypothetical protein